MASRAKLATVEDEIQARDTQPHVYRAICEIQGELAKTGIAKNRQNNQPGANYAFRGIDDVYAALSPLLARHSLVVIPRIIERTLDVRQSAQGKPLFNVAVHAEFDFVSAIDGTSHTAATYGEAMDSSDKATNKAMSAAYKYAAFMTFAIPTEGDDNDADATTHDVAGFITPQQRDDLEALATEVGADIPRFCKYFGVKTLSCITPDRYGAAVEALKAKKKEPANA